MELEKNIKTRKLLQRLLKLEDKVVGKPFPGMKRVRQISSYHCGPAVIVELFSFLGKNISQIAIVRSLRAKNKIRRLGLNIHDLARATNILGKNEVVFWRKRQSTINDLSNIVNKYHYPVAVEWQGVFYEDEDEDSGHYAVITKVDKKSNYLNYKRSLIFGSLFYIIAGTIYLVFLDRFTRSFSLVRHSFFILPIFYLCLAL